MLVSLLLGLLLIIFDQGAASALKGDEMNLSLREVDEQVKSQTKRKFPAMMQVFIFCLHFLCYESWWTNKPLNFCRGVIGLISSLIDLQIKYYLKIQKTTTRIKSTVDHGISFDKTTHFKGTRLSIDMLSMQSTGLPHPVVRAAMHLH